MEDATMTKKEAHEVLREFQMWRRAEGTYKWVTTPTAFPYSARTVGIALDVAIETLKKEVV